VLERTRLRVAETQARATALGDAQRQKHRSVDAAFEMVDRDGDIGGGIIAGALAYRLFIWLLPLALVAVAGLGIAADAADESPQETADGAGLGGLVTSSISDSATSSGRWYALIIGIPILVYVTRSVLRALIAAHRLIWTQPRAETAKPTLPATLRLLGLLLLLPIASGLASAIRAHSPGVGVLGTAVTLLPYAGIWLLVTDGLPHRDAPWSALIPGALLFGFGLDLLHVLLAYFLVPYALAKQGTYGALGIAAALLFGLYLVSRLVVAAAVVNATLWERRSSAEPAAAA
jgi:membrane protein